MSKAIIKTALWSIFSATLGITAITLPVHIFAELQGKELANEKIWLAYGSLVFVSALYLTTYRIYTLLLDLGLEKFHKALGWIFIGVFLVGIATFTFA